MVFLEAQTERAPKANFGALAMWGRLAAPGYFEAPWAAFSIRSATALGFET
jgi:hypothetical protein